MSLNSLLVKETLLKMFTTQIILYLNDVNIKTSNQHEENHGIQSKAQTTAFFLFSTQV